MVYIRLFVLERANVLNLLLDQEWMKNFTNFIGASSVKLVM